MEDILSLEDGEGEEGCCEDAGGLLKLIAVE